MVLLTSPSSSHTLVPETDTHFNTTRSLVYLEGEGYSVENHLSVEIGHSKRKGKTSRFLNGDFNLYGL